MGRARGILKQVIVAVVDASVSVKWVNPNEPYSKEANEMYEDFLKGDLFLIAPNFWPYEVSNGVYKAVARKELSQDLGKDSSHRWVEREGSGCL